MWDIDGKLLFFQYGCIFTEFNRIFMKATLIFPLVNLEKAVSFCYTIRDICHVFICHVFTCIWYDKCYNTRYIGRGDQIIAILTSGVL